MNYSYKCVKQHLCNQYIGTYVTYGIALNNTIIIDDVSCSKDFVEGVTVKLNQFGVSPVHVKDVILDLLS